MAHFYKDIIEIESILIELDELNLTGEQKLHLASLIDSTIHQNILDMILSKLPERDKVLFVNKLKVGSEDKELMDFISSKIENVEDEIKKAVRDLKQELHEDIKEAKNK